MTPAPKRRWFRFSLRTLFVVLTIVGIWLGYHVNWIRERHAAQEWLDNHGVPGNFGGVSEASPPLSWSLRVLGEEPYFEFLSVDRGDAEDEDVYRKDLRRIERLFPECQVYDTSTWLE